MQVPLNDRHESLGAKMVDFSGWRMPIHYHSILEEHKAVREKAGLFDVSHMARIGIVGVDALKFLDYLVVTKIKGPGRATYTCFCNETGGTIDDLIVYQESSSSLFIVANSSRREADLAHLYKQSNGYDVQIVEYFKDEGILALQGPKSSDYFQLIKPWTFEKRGDLIISGTGYTGSGGVEIFGPTLKIRDVWDQLISAGVQPIGLGARDTLRLEKGYALYGHELNEEISPKESVSAWTISSDKDFYGKEASSEKNRHALAVKFEGMALPRQGFEVFDGDKRVGIVTSGGFSPSLKIPIALVLVDEAFSIGKQLTIPIRGSQVQVEVVQLPFL